MAELVVRYPDRTAEHFPLNRLRITIGRSARNDLCIPDPFASRVHAEVRHEGDEYFLQDLGSANGTLYNGAIVDAAIPLTRGGRIQIGETEIVFNDGPYPLSSGSTMITEQSTSMPEATIALSSADRTTSGLFQQIEGALSRSQESAAAEKVEQATADGRTAARAVFEAFAGYREELAEASEYLAARVADLDDVRDRAVARLLGVPMPGVPDPGHPFVLVARDLAPADTAALDRLLDQGASPGLPFVPPGPPA